MLIYNIVFGINFLLALININDPKKVQKLLYISFVVLSTFLCLNYTNGIDWANYQFIYLENLGFDDMILNDNYFLKIIKRDQSEVGFFYLMSIFKMFGFNYEIFQFILLSIIMTFMYKLISKFTEYSLIGIAIYYSYFMLDTFFEPIFRQFIAMIIFYISVNNIIDKKFIKYFLKILFAFLFHNSSIILIVLYFIPRKKIKLYFLVIILIVSCFANTFLNEMLDIATNILPQLNKYSTYLKIKEYGFKNTMNFIFLVKVLSSLFIGVYVTKNKSYLSIKSQEIFYIIINFYWINEVIFILKRQVVIFFRLQFYFEIFYIIIITFLMKILIRKYGKKLGIMIFIIYSIFYYRIMYNAINDWKGKDSMKFFPYTNYVAEVIFNNDIKEDYEKINFRLKSKKSELNNNGKI